MPEPEESNVTQLHRLDDEALYQLSKHEEDIDCAGAAAEIRALRQAVEIAYADAERFKQEHLNACALIAQMHAACTGDTNGPRRGVVEDIATMRQVCIRMRIALDQSVELDELQEKRIEELTRARDTLGARLLELIDPKDQVGRARVQALLKAGNVEAETPTIVPG